MKNIQVGRLDNNKRVEVDDETTISEALEDEGFTIGSNEVIQDIGGTEYSGDEEVSHGKGYFLVQKVKSGC